MYLCCMDTNVGEKIAMGRGGNGMMKFGGTGVGRGSPGRRKKKIGRPSLKQGNPNWGNKNAANVNLAGVPSPRKRGRPPSKNVPIFNPENAETSAPPV